jgi:hypothetical protein
VQFDPKHGFDAEAVTAIEEAYQKIRQPHASPQTVLAQTTEAARDYLKAKAVKRTPLAEERDRLRRELRLLGRLDANLRETYIVDLRGTPTRKRQVVAHWKKRAERLIKDYDGALAKQKRHDLMRDNFYGRLLQIWREAGGPLGVSPIGPLINFLFAVISPVAGKTLTVPAMQKIVRRWKPWIVSEHERRLLEQRQARQGVWYW